MKKIMRNNTVTQMVVMVMQNMEAGFFVWQTVVLTSLLNGIQMTSKEMENILLITYCIMVVTNILVRSIPKAIFTDATVLTVVKEFFASVIGAVILYFGVKVYVANPTLPLVIGVIFAFLILERILTKVERVEYSNCNSPMGKAVRVETLEKNFIPWIRSSSGVEKNRASKEKV